MAARLIGDTCSNPSFAPYSLFVSPPRGRAPGIAPASLTRTDFAIVQRGSLSSAMAHGFGSRGQLLTLHVENLGHVRAICFMGLASSGQSRRDLHPLSALPSLSARPLRSIDASAGTMVGQGEGNRLLVCQDTWPDQGDKPELHFVGDAIFKITAFVGHFRCGFVWFVVSRCGWSFRCHGVMVVMVFPTGGENDPFSCTDQQLSLCRKGLGVAGSGEGVRGGVCHGSAGVVTRSSLVLLISYRHQGAREEASRFR